MILSALGRRERPNFACSSCFPPKHRKPTGPQGTEILLSLQLKPTLLARRGTRPLSPHVWVCRQPCQGQEPGQPTRVVMRLCLSIYSANSICTAHLDLTDNTPSPGSWENYLSHSVYCRRARPRSPNACLLELALPLNTYGISGKPFASGVCFSVDQGWWWLRG